MVDTGLQCKICKKVFKTNQILTRHLKKHYVGQIDINGNKVKCECEVCHKFISKNNIMKHLRSHETHPKYHTAKTQHVSHKGLNCIYCEKLCKNKNSLAQHECRCKLNPNKYSVVNNFGSYSANGCTAWNKGLTKETDIRVARYAKTFSTNYQAGLFTITNRSADPEVRAKLRKAALDNIQSGKVIPICHARGHKGYYNGIWCDSSWELAFVIYCISNKIPVMRNFDRFEYNFGGNTHIYVPDFYLPDTQQYVEIKGYKDKKAIAKAEQCYTKYNVVEYDAKKLQPILDFVKSNFGNNFISLYDN